MTEQTGVTRSPPVTDLEEDLIRTLLDLPSEARREAYRGLVRTAQGRSDVSPENPVLKEALGGRLYTTLTEALSANPTPGRRIIWRLYEELFQNSRTTELGQYFTPDHVIDFALSGIYESPETILDPMAGHGAFLRRANDRFPKSEIIGVEIDELLTDCGHLVLDDEVRLVQRDVFSWAMERVHEDPETSFSAVIGNPAYVSYQRLQDAGAYSPGYTESQGAYRAYLLESLRTIAKEKGRLHELTRLFDSWSGYSDLSVYALILSWLLVEEGGTIAFVMTNHWMERDYGQPVKKFLSTHGTVRAILSHRRGNWFPNAQIPTSVIVYRKGEGEGLPDGTNIPYVECLDTHTEDLSSFLHDLLDQGFWEWIDSVDQPGMYGSLYVSLLKWFQKDARIRDGDQPPKESRHLRLPACLDDHELVTFDDVGWMVHQGLRTGCNDVFYVGRTPQSEQDSVYEVAVPSADGLEHTEIQIPSVFLLPAVKNLPGKSPPLLDESKCDSFLLDLRKAILPRDADRISEYPDEWIREWGYEGIDEIPQPLASQLEQWEEAPYPKGKGDTRVPELTAVKPNTYLPDSDYQGIPDPPSFWYQLPLSRRHFGDLIIPRVSSGPVRGFRVEDSTEIVTDANFVTFISESPSLSAETLQLWLNSNAFRVICELNGVPLGGGALKLEATLVKKIPVPVHPLQSLDRPDSRIVEDISRDRLLESGRVIDERLFGEQEAVNNLQLLRKLISQRQVPTGTGSNNGS